jgi:enoyl-CoA hydratase
MHSDDFSPALCSGGQVLARRQGPLGLITLHRAAALNALSLGMVRDRKRGLTALLTKAQ